MATVCSGLRAVSTLLMLMLLPLAAQGQEWRQVLPVILDNTVNSVIQQEIQRGSNPLFYSTLFGAARTSLLAVTA
jgi:hypothetical protein